MDNKKGKDFDLSSFISLVKSAEPSVWMILVGIFGSLLATGISLALPLFAKNFIDHFSIDSLNGKIIFIILGLFIFRVLFGAFSNYLLSKAGQQVVARLREQIWNKLIRMPVSYFDQNTSGELVSRVVNDTSVVQQVITSYLAQLVSGTITIIGVSIILLAMNWQMTLLMLVGVPIMFGLVFQLGKRMAKVARATQDELANFSGKIQQTLSEIRLMKISTAEEIERTKAERGIKKLYALGLKEAKIVSVIGPFMSVIIMFLLLLIFGYGGIEVAKGRMTIGSLIAFLLFLFQLLQPIVAFTQLFTQFQRAAGATNRISKILELEEESKEKGMSLDILSLPLTFKNVDFSYEENQKILKDISFQAKAGEKTAFVGPSGGGKTTLFYLIEQFYNVDTGEILIGQHPIQELSKENWRNQIAYVSQENAMLSGRIRDNLIYGLDDAEEISDDKIWEALEMAYAAEFVETMNDKLDTVVGERGMNLSGGQRQRISIARAFLRNPKLLMLDEATASLDSQSEGVVQEALKGLMNGRTTLVIAHRLSTIVDAEQILFIEDGKITGRGRHEELIEKHDLYRIFASQQLA
ncbi:MAG: ABC transporter ATP-binding protein/permease [Atopostipes suicloacalis]|nr:ABC transporter ATP-binding protein/permease [Atopostipes suicloacalis]